MIIGKKLGHLGLLNDEQTFGNVNSTQSNLELKGLEPENKARLTNWNGKHEIHGSILDFQESGTTTIHF